VGVPGWLVRDVPGIRHPDPVLREETAVAARLAAEELEGGPVAVLGHHPPRAVAHDVVAEHPHVVASRLDEQDVHLGVLAAVALQAVLHAAVEHDPHGLVQDPADPVVAQVAAEGPVRGVVQVGHDGIDADDEVGPVPDGEVDVGRLLHPAVHVVAAGDADGAIEAGEGGGGLDGLRDRQFGEAVPPEGDRLAAVEVDRDHVELPGQVPEAIAAEPREEDPMQVLLDAGRLHEAGGQELEEGRDEVGEVPALPGEARDQGPGEDPRGADRAPQELERPEPVEGSRGHAEGRMGARRGLVVHLAR